MQRLQVIFEFVRASNVDSGLEWCTINFLLPLSRRGLRKIRKVPHQAETWNCKGCKSIQATPYDIQTWGILCQTALEINIKVFDSFQDSWQGLRRNYWRRWDIEEHCQLHQETCLIFNYVSVLRKHARLIRRDHQEKKEERKHGEYDFLVILLDHEALFLREETQTRM